MLHLKLDAGPRPSATAQRLHVLNPSELRCVLKVNVSGDQSDAGPRMLSHGLNAGREHPIIR